MTQNIRGTPVDGWLARLPGANGLVRSLLVLGLVASSAGCILTQDIPDPALDVPDGYKTARLRTATDAPPPLDWWRAFRSAELTQLMEEAQTVNLDIAAATARFIQADAQARIAGAALLPSLSGSGSESYGRTSGSSASGLTNGGRETVNYSASLSASYQLDFWGQNRDAAQAAEETAVANRFDRDVVALTTLTTVANAYFQVLASQDRIRTAERNIASATRILDAIKDRLKAGTGTDLDVAQQESVLANQRASVPPLRQTLDQNINALATLVSRPPEAVRVAGGSLNQIAIAAGHAGPAVGIADAAARHPAAGSATGLCHGQCRQRPRAIFPEHSVDRAGRLSKLGAGVAVPAACGVLQPGRQRDPADLRRRKDPRQFRIQQGETGRTAADLSQDRGAVVRRRRQRADGDSPDHRSSCGCKRDVLAASRRAFELSEQQLRAGTADIVTVLNTQVTLFQAEDALSQAQLARLLAIVSLYQALGGGWEPRMEKPVDAL